MAETEATAWYDYNGLPAYRDGKGILIVTPGGEEKPVHDLVKFVHEAQPITEAEFQRLKGSEPRADEQERVPAGSPDGGQFAGGGGASGVLTNQQVSTKLATEAHQKRAEAEARLAAAKSPNDKKIFAARVSVLKELAASHEADQGKYAEAEAVVRGSEHGTGKADPATVAAAKEHLSANHAANERRYQLSKAVSSWENSEAERRFRAQQREIQR